MPDPDTFASAIPLDVLPRLLGLGLRYGFDPLSSVEMESYFLNLLARAPLEEIELRIIPDDFRSLSAPPIWLQNPDWPLYEGRPMTFAGQVNFPIGSGFSGNPTAYVFADSPTGVVCTIRPASLIVRRVRLRNSREGDAGGGGVLAAHDRAEPHRVLTERAVDLVHDVRQRRDLPVLFK